MVLLVSNEDDMSEALFDKLAKRTGCEVKHVGEETLLDVEKWRAEKGLDWKEVAFMGTNPIPCFRTCHLCSFLNVFTTVNTALKLSLFLR